MSVRMKVRTARFDTGITQKKRQNLCIKTDLYAKKKTPASLLKEAARLSKLIGRPLNELIFTRQFTL